MQQKKIISGLDVMKFIMAFLIVDIHVHGSIITPPQTVRKPCFSAVYHYFEGI